jgi:hypothetical protein
MNSAYFCSLLFVCCCLFVRSSAWIFCVATHAIAGEDLEAAAGAGAEQQAEVRAVLAVLVLSWCCQLVCLFCSSVHIHMFISTIQFMFTIQFMLKI